MTGISAAHGQMSKGITIHSRIAGGVLSQSRISVLGFLASTCDSIATQISRAVPKARFGHDQTSGITWCCELDVSCGLDCSMCLLLTLCK